MKKISVILLALVLVFSISALVLAEASNNEAWIKQNGADNDAMINQKGFVLYAFAEQNGNGNEVDIWQFGDTNRAMTEQNGTANKVFVWQDNPQAAHVAEADITQNGDSNKAYVYQYSSMLNQMVPRPKDVTVEQYGADNEALVVQGFGGRMIASVAQFGSENKARQYQEHAVGDNYLSAGITQEGYSNYARQTQWGFGNLWATIDQTGSDNVAIQIQNSPLHPKGLQTDARIYQSGTANLARIIQ